MPANNLAALKLRDTPMRLTLSASVANDLGALKKSLKELAERLGHTSCATGCNEFFLGVERHYVATANKASVALHAHPLSVVGLPSDPVPWKTVRVTAPGAVFDDIDTLSSSIEKVLGRLGCGKCCSGFDVLFQRELDGFQFDERLGLRGTGQFA